jgi:hypothetical protein
MEPFRAEFDIRNAPAGYGGLDDGFGAEFILKQGAQSDRTVGMKNLSSSLVFPDKLAIRVSEAESHQPLSKIALMLTFFARKKNNYHLPKVTGRDGATLVTVGEVRESIATDQKLFIMDYASSLEDCYPEVEIKVCSKEEVQRAIEAMEAVTKIDESLIADFRNCQNHLFEPVIQEVLLDEPRAEQLVQVKIHYA